MISWEPLIERHMKGTCARGAVWIRVDRLDEVTGLYFVFNSVVKMVPRLDKEKSVVGAKLWAEEQLQLMDWAEELEKMNT
jgi:hypothetical protein